MSELEPSALEGEYFDPDDPLEPLRRAVVFLALWDLALQHLETSGRAPATTRALRLVLPRIDWHALQSEAGRAG